MIVKQSSDTLIAMTASQKGFLGHIFGQKIGILFGGIDLEHHNITATDSFPEEVKRSAEPTVAR